MKNREIRDKVSANGMRLWELADELGIADTTLSRWLRHELPEDRKRLIVETIDKLVARRDSL